MDILIVEDEGDILDFLRSYFADRGHTVMTASTVEESMGWLRAAAPDLALVDLRLPHGHGRMIVKAIKDRHLATKIAVVTACDDLDVRRELLGCGVDHYLFKPVALKDLEALLTIPRHDSTYSDGNIPSPSRSNGLEGEEST